MNAFARSNLSVALLRLQEAKHSLETLQHRPRRTFEEVCELFKSIGAIEWSVREAQRLVENATALDEMESTDTLPMPPESGARRAGG
jgi:geranylgeranyl pyrophosphate synthase